MDVELAASSNRCVTAGPKGRIQRIASVWRNQDPDLVFREIRKGHRYKADQKRQVEDLSHNDT